MKIFDLFSKRQADAAKSGQPDVYQYEQIPDPLRVQVHQISLEAIGKVGSHGDRFTRPDRENTWWAHIEKIYLREKGLDRIGIGDFSGSRILSFMRSCSSDEWLDFLELIAVAIHIVGDNETPYFRQQWEVTSSPEEAIGEINYRIRQAGVGFQIENLRVIRVDSQYIHSEIVKPTLSLLAEEGFDGPRQEFLAAHQHYRAGEHRQAVAMAANALESTFKAVFEQKGWTFNKGARISDLVKVGRANGLWPEYLDASFDQLIATLQSGLPKIRDNDASHGQGARPREVPAYIAAYALHLAASKIVFVSEAAKDR